MKTALSGEYWSTAFRVTRQDLDEIAAGFRATRQARDLTALARRLVQSRLQNGRVPTEEAGRVWSDDPSVRLWDPAGEWRIGDRVIVARRVSREQFEAAVGEITEVRPAEAQMQLDGEEQAVRYRRARRGSREARAWYDTVKAVVADKFRGRTVEEHADAVLLTHGEQIVSRLLGALQRDRRFVSVEGRWFLKGLATAPAREQVTAAAWALATEEEPQPTEALLAPAGLAHDDVSLFGLYLALAKRPDLFINVSPGPRPRWQLAGPPPGRFVARAAAYDPADYRVLCVPGERVSAQRKGRLWELGLLAAVMGSPVVTGSG